jgi:RNA polymerase sigma-70 factor (ECF subfamily)
MEFCLPIPGIDNDKPFRPSNLQMPLDISDDGLMRRLRAGDEEAFTTVFRRWQGPLFRFALHMSGSRTLAEDATQEVFMTLIRQTAQFDPAKGALGAFLFGIARNQVLKRFERERPYVPFAPGSEDDQVAATNGNGAAPAHFNSAAPAEDSARTETIELVRQAILTLPPDYREAVALCDLEEMSYEQAAAALGCAAGTVASRLHRGRALLAAKLRKSRAPGAAKSSSSVITGGLAVIPSEARNLVSPESTQHRTQKAPK